MTSEHTPTANAADTFGVCMFRWHAPRVEDLADGAVTDPEIITTDVEHVCARPALLPAPTNHEGGHICTCGAGMELS